MNRKLKEVNAKIEGYQNELEELHIYEPSEAWYRIRRHELELKIAQLESIADEIREDERMFRPMKYMLYGFIGAAMLLLLWAYVKSH
jgi:hypothetical protein